MNGNADSTSRGFDRDTAPDLSADAWPGKFDKAMVRRGRPREPRPGDALSLRVPAPEPRVERSRGTSPGSAGRWPASPGAAPGGAGAGQRPALPPRTNAAPCSLASAARRPTGIHFPEAIGAHGRQYALTLNPLQPAPIRSDHPGTSTGSVPATSTRTAPYGEKTGALFHNACNQLTPKSNISHMPEFPPHLQVLV